MEMMESIMVTFTSAAARSVFGSVKDSGQIVTTQAAWYRMMSFVVDRKDERQGKDHEQVGRDQAQILDAHHMFGIVLHLLKIAGADALGADREECESEGHSRQDREVCDIVADCVCRE